MRVRCFIVAAIGILVTAAPASAATIRYATPGAPDSGPCSATTKCSLERAVELAAAGDTVSVAPGTYTDADQISTSAAIAILGEPGEPRATLQSTYAGGVALSTTGALRDLRVVASGTNATAVRAGAFERVIGQATGSGGVGCSLFSASDSAAADTACVGTAIGATVTSGTTPLLLRNVTARGGSIGLQISNLGGAAVNLVNTIAAGPTWDIQIAPFLNEYSPVSSSHSSYSRVTPADKLQSDGTDQSSAPSFRGPGDFHQSYDSPTRNAGAASGAGASDADGEPRVLEDAVDIGADEVAGPPTAVLGGPSAITQTSATVGGTASGRGLAGTVVVEFGESTSYGGRTAEQSLGAAATSFAAAIDGLKPATTYHYRLVATTKGGAAVTADGSFTTSPPPPPPPDRTAPVISDVALTARKFRVGPNVTAVAARTLAATPKGTTLLFTSSEPGTAQVTIERLTKGRLSAAKQCRVGRAVKRGKRCTKATALGRLDRSVLGSTNKVAFSGRFGTAQLSKKLAPGRYRFSTKVTDAAGNTSAPAYAEFTVVR